MIRKIKKIELSDNQPQTAEEPLIEEQLASELGEEEKDMKKNSKAVYVVFGLLILLGIGTGYILSRSSSLPGTNSTSGQNGTSGKNSVGASDTTAYKDWAEGTLQDGGLDGEGSHQLIRDGGPSQTVYLISSVVDLSQFVGKKVKVWGATMAAKKAAWLMDVGKVETE